MIDMRDKVRALVSSNLPPDLLVELVIDAVKSGLGSLGGRPRKPVSETPKPVIAEKEPVSPASADNETREIPPLSGAIAVVSAPVGGGGVSVSESALVLSPSPGSDLQKASDLKSLRHRRSDEPDDFVAFMERYPAHRRTGRKTALGYWRNLSANDRALCFQALTWQVTSHDWTKENGSFVPHPERYLAKERFRAQPPPDLPAVSAREQQTADAFAENREIARRFASERSRT